MLSSVQGWTLSITIIGVVWIWLMIQKGPAVALAAAVLMSFAAPVWIRQNVFGLPFTVQTSMTAIAMLGYAVHPKGKIISPLTLLDFCIAFLCISHIAADSFT